MKRILDSFNRRGSSQDRRTQNVPLGESPESTILREVNAFCQSNAPNSPTAGSEFLHLPVIVDAAESSPAAAREGANCIRKFLAKDYTNRAYAQYNAVMLMRILADNPGRTFTRNFDATFVKAVKELLREGQDLSVQQILRETLDSFATTENAHNETLAPLMEMWKREKAKNNTKVYGNSAGPLVSMQPPQVSQAGNHFARQHRQTRSLPPPDELAARIEEARTTAKLLSQTVQSTPSTELPNSDLIKEFADRASSASRSIQGYIHSTNPAPDESTLLTLIETNDQLSIAMSKHQRALLQARRTLSPSLPATAPSQTDQVNYPAPTGPPPGALKPQDYVYPPPSSPPQRAPDHIYSSPHHPPPQRAQPGEQHREATSRYDVPENPFADEGPHQPAAPMQPYGLFHRPHQARPPSGPEQTPQQYRPEHQMPSFQSTPSYAYRQEPAANDLAMHGASPPPPDHQGQTDVQQRMANTRVA